MHYILIYTDVLTHRNFLTMNTRQKTKPLAWYLKTYSLRKCEKPVESIVSLNCQRLSFTSQEYSLTITRDVLVWKYLNSIQVLVYPHSLRRGLLQIQVQRMYIFVSPMATALYAISVQICYW